MRRWSSASLSARERTASISLFFSSSTIRLIFFLKEFAAKQSPDPGFENGMSLDFPTKSSAPASRPRVMSSLVSLEVSMITRRMACDLPMRSSFVDAAAHFDSVHLGHDQVDHDAVERFLRDAVQRLLPAALP